MIRDLFPDDDRFDSLGSSRTGPRLVLGLFVLSIGGGYAVSQFALGDFRPEFDLLILVLGTVLGATLIAEYVSSRDRSMYQGLLLPAVELLTAYSLFGILTVSVYSGLAAAGVASGLLLFCSFLAIVLTI